MNCKINTLFTLLLCLGICSCGSKTDDNSLKQGIAALEAKNYSAAINQLTRTMRHASESADLYYHLGSAYLGKGEMDPAKDAFAAALKLKPDYAEAIAGLGQIAYHTRELQKAGEYFSLALEGKAASKETTASILNGLALVYSAEQQYDLARLELIKAQKLCSSYAPTYYNLASLYRDHYTLREEALDYFELYLRLTEKSDSYHEKAANNIKRLQLHIERTKADKLDNAKRNSTLAAKHLHEAVAAQSGKQYARAAKLFRDALDADPLAFNAAYGLGLMLQMQNRKTEAFDAFKTAAAIHPGHLECHRQGAELAIQLRRYDEARKLLDRAIARSPFTPFNAEMMARICNAESRFTVARAYGEFYLTLLDPENKQRAAYEKWIRSLPVK